jgi:hypothetical protein
MNLPDFDFSWLNVPVAIGLVKVLLDLGKHKYLIQRIEKNCCLTTLKCPLGGKECQHGTEKTSIAPSHEKGKVP